MLHVPHPVDKVNHWTPRLLINRERVGEADPIDRLRGFNRGFNFGKGNQRDALYEGDCDDGVRQLCALLGWEEELETLAQAWGKQATEEAQEDAGTAAEQKAET